MINVVKAIGATIPIQTESYRASSSVKNSSSNPDEKVFWDALRNACRVYIELAFGSHSLLTIQALVGLVRGQPQYDHPHQANGHQRAFVWIVRPIPCLHTWFLLQPYV